MKRLISLLALTILGASGTTAFAETGLYGGLGVGGAKISADVDTPFVDDAVPPNSIVVDFDEYDASFKAFAGYRFLDWLAGLFQCSRHSEFHTARTPPYTDRSCQSRGAAH